MDKKGFPNYLELKPRLPQWVWHIFRFLTFLLTLFVVYTLFVNPELGLTLFWKLLIPLLPASFALIPGLWRNICPMAFLNQIPQLTGFGGQRTLPSWTRNLALLLSIVAFIVFVTSRAPLLNHSATAVGIMLISVLLLAFTGGILFKGRSGWCGTFCPLAPLQKVYGHAPLFIVRNGYCKHCVGCQKNCYDFNPRAAVFSDLRDNDIRWSDKRKYFAALLPGLIIGYFNASQPAETGLGSYYLSILLPLLVAIGLYQTLRNIFHISHYKLVALFGLAALTVFYWYGTPIFASAVESVFRLTLPDGAVISVQIGITVLCIAVAVRGLLSEHAYNQAVQSSAGASIGNGVNALKTAIRNSAGNPEVRERDSDKNFEVRPEHTLLDAIEAAELPIMSGCRMGMCGSDPVVIVAGADNLAPPDGNELTTLRRLGLEGKARLACCCKPTGNITIDLNAEFEAVDPDIITPSIDQAYVAVDNRLKVVIVGNGIAGISTAETLRQFDTDCIISLISREPHHFYNRMGLEKVVYGRTAMQGLYLMQEEWYQRNNIGIWLNTQVLSIDTDSKKILLGTSERLEYDKLVLATGGVALIPSAPEFNLPGCFTIRDASNAVSIRAWVQTHRCKHAVVLGGGVLGIEAADALRKLGLKTTIINRSHRVMERQLDLSAGVILKRFLENNGIKVLTQVSVVRASGSDRIEQVILTNGEVLSADLLLLCVGIRANTELAKTAGLDINRGVIVDQQMRTSNPDIYCVGDAAELPNAISGLWSVGSEQGKIAAAALLGNDARYQAEAVTPIQLKLSGIDLKGFGDVTEDNETESYTGGDVSEHCWKHVSVKNHRIAGGVFVNQPFTANAVISAANNSERKITKEEITALMNRD